MKTAIYINEGVVQLVLTPDTEWEKKCLNSFKDKPMEIKVYEGEFAESQGGYYRNYSSNYSLFIVNKVIPEEK